MNRLVWIVGGGVVGLTLGWFITLGLGINPWTKQKAPQAHNPQPVVQRAKKETPKTLATIQLPKARIQKTLATSRPELATVVKEPLPEDPPNNPSPEAPLKSLPEETDPSPPPTEETEKVPEREPEPEKPNFGEEQQLFLFPSRR